MVHWKETTDAMRKHPPVRKDIVVVDGGTYDDVREVGRLHLHLHPSNPQTCQLIVEVVLVVVVVDVVDVVVAVDEAILLAVDAIVVFVALYAIEPV